MAALWSSLAIVWSLRRSWTISAGTFTSVNVWWPAEGSFSWDRWIWELKCDSERSTSDGVRCRLVTVCSSSQVKSLKWFSWKGNFTKSFTEIYDGCPIVGSDLAYSCFPLPFVYRAKTKRVHDQRIRLWELILIVQCNLLSARYTTFRNWMMRKRPGVRHNSARGETPASARRSAMEWNRP